MLKSTSSVFEELRSETTEEDDANGTETEMEGGGQPGAATEADRMRNAHQTSNEEAEEEQDHVLTDLDAAHRETLVLQCQGQSPDTSGGVAVQGRAEAEEEQPGPSHSQHSFSVKPHHKMTPAELQQHQLMQQSYIKQEVYEIDKTIREFWPAKKRRFNESTDTDMREVGRKMELPMARVKKIMRIDDEMKNMMIASDAPLFLAMACELFVEELTLLSWQVVEDGRRKTMQKSDVATAVALHDHLDFLVDIVPREEKKYLPTFAQNRQQQQQPQASHSHSQQPECSTSSSSHSSHQQPQQSQSMQQVTQQVTQLQPGQAVVLTALPAENGFIVPVSANAQGTQIIQLGTLSQAPEQLQYVFADVATVNGEEWQLENGITVHATPIGQPFPIDQSDPNATIHMLPPGVQIIQVPSQNIELNGQHLQMQQVQQVKKISNSEDVRMDADVDEMETRRKQREKHKRRSTMNARTDQDVVALFQHNEYLDFFNVGIVEHQPIDKREQPIYTIQTEGGPNIAEMGTEVDSLDEGYDYAVVYVNKETGKRCIRSARVLKFDSRFSSQMDVLLGKRNKPEVTYRDDAGIDKEKLVEERKTLTTSFGSSRKVKMEERGQRRKVEKETLEEMKQTAFTSNSVLANGDDVKVDHITMVKKAESSVLPPAVSDANFPNDIYPTSLFVSEEEVAELGQVGMEFLQTADKKKLKSQGFPICVLQSWNSLPFADPTSDPQKAALLVLLATQVSFLSILCKGHGASITRAEVDSFPYPQPFVDKVKAQYMPSDYDRGSHNRGVARLRLSPTEKDRMMAYTLALALGISHQNIIGINSWHKSTNFPITKLEKMLEALGCDIFVFDTEQAYRHDSLRGARLLRPPSNEAKKIRKRRR